MTDETCPYFKAMLEMLASYGSAGNTTRTGIASYVKRARRFPIGLVERFVDDLLNGEIERSNANYCPNVEQFSRLLRQQKMSAAEADWLKHQRREELDQREQTLAGQISHEAPLRLVQGKGAS